jgi:hypothetical protein
MCCFRCALFVNELKGVQMKKRGLFLLSGLIAGQLFGGITLITEEKMPSQGKSELVSTVTTTVRAGDLVVITAGTNKKASVNREEFSSSAGAFTVVKSGDLTVDDSGKEPNPEAYLAYLVVPASGSYDFTMTSTDLRMTSSAYLYVFRGDEPLAVTAQDAGAWSSLAAGNTAEIVLELGLGAQTLGESTVLVGAGSSLRGALGSDLDNYVANNDELPKRVVAYEIVDNNSEASQAVIWTDTNNDERERSGSGSVLTLAFSEVASGDTSAVQSIGAKVDVASIALAEGSSKTSMKPGDVFELVVTSVNNGDAAANNVRNSLKADPAVFRVTPLSSDLYSVLEPGATASTTYRVEVLGGAGDGSYGFDVENKFD